MLPAVKAHGLVPEWIRRRWSEAGVQVRSAIAATLVLVVLVTAASGLLLLLLRRSLTNGIDSTARARAADIAAQVEIGDDGGLVDADKVHAALNVEAVHRTWVQVIDSDGGMLAGTPGVDGRGPLVDVKPCVDEVISLDGTFSFDDDAYRVVARGGSSHDRRFTVLVGQSLSPVESTTKTAFLLLAAGNPLLLLAIAAATFVFVGRSLRPVERIRRTVEQINHSDLGERLEVPPGDDEVARLARTMNAMLQRLQVAQRTQRQFVSDASHELRSPVATLMASAEVAQTHQDPLVMQEFPGVVFEESRRLERLVSGLLLLARADDQGIRPVFEDVDLDDVLDGERARIVALSLPLTVSTDITAARVRGDRHQLEQVVRNLVDNAVRHARSQVSLSVRREAGGVVLEVADDGAGVAAEDRERIFQRFVRLQESRDRASGGAGLGLAIVREIVLAHGGTVEAGENPDGAPGARFTVRLPAN